MTHFKKAKGKPNSARKRSTTARGTKYAAKGHRMPIWGYLVFGILFGALVTFYAFQLTRQPISAKKLSNVKSNSSNINSSNVVTSNNHKSHKPKHHKPKHHKPKFEFYTELTKDALVSQKTSEKKTPPQPLKNPKSTTYLYKYIVQAGSFKQIVDAERLKAELTLNGFEPHIETVTLTGNQIWHRVTIGPFTSEAQAKEQQQLLNALASIKVNGTLLIVKKN